MQKTNYLGTGEFGDIYEGPKGAEAEVFMLENKSGEIRNAFYHESIGSDIDLVWGDEKGGYAKIVKKHPEVIGKIQDIFNRSKVTSISPNRVRLESDQYRSAISLNWYGKPKKWVLTSFDKTLPKTK